MKHPTPSLMTLTCLTMYEADVAYAILIESAAWLNSRDLPAWLMPRPLFDQRIAQRCLYGASVEENLVGVMSLTDTQSHGQICSQTSTSSGSRQCMWHAPLQAKELAVFCSRLPRKSLNSTVSHTLCSTVIMAMARCLPIISAMGTNG
jgi:phage-related protein